MKKIVLLALVAVISIPAAPQSRKYKKAMSAAIEKMNEATDVESKLNCAATFEEIAEKFPDQWLPVYHAARIVVAGSFEESDAQKKDSMLVHAKKWVDMALDMVPGESEVRVLESLYFIGMMAVDPMTRGQVYYQDALEAIQKAKNLNPENPRAWYMDAMMTLNMPEFLGGGPEAAKPIFLEAAEKFKTYHNDDPLWPVWGEELNQAELNHLE